VTECRTSAALLPDGDRNHDCTHHIIQLEITFGAVGMRVVATEAGLGGREIGIHRLKIARLPDLHKAGVGSIRLRQDGSEPGLLKLVRRDIALVDRPQADQPVLDA
jgi:hypothetical protein